MWLLFDEKGQFIQYMDFRPPSWISGWRRHRMSTAEEPLRSLPQNYGGSRWNFVSIWHVSEVKNTSGLVSAILNLLVMLGNSMWLYQSQLVVINLSIPNKSKCDCYLTRKANSYMDFRPPAWISGWRRHRRKTAEEPLRSLPPKNMGVAAGILFLYSTELEKPWG